MKNLNTLIVPDIHCRDFWKIPVETVLRENPDADVVFLGDYLDPYHNEWVTSPYNPIQVGFNNLKEIIKLAKKHKNVHLLLGNHDCSYIGPIDVCYVRHDNYNDQRNRRLFWENEKLFNIIFEKEINGKEFQFSHAGYNKGWLTYNNVYFESVLNNKVKLSDFLNNNFHASCFNDGNNQTFDEFWGVMGQWDRHRSLYGYENGSIIWTDIQTHYDKKKENKTDKTIQIFGHTMLKIDAFNINNNRYCLDSLQCFYIDNEGEVRKYNDDKIAEITKIKRKK